MHFTHLEFPTDDANTNTQHKEQQRSDKVMTPTLSPKCESSNRQRPCSQLSVFVILLLWFSGKPCFYGSTAAIVMRTTTPTRSPPLPPSLSERDGGRRTTAIFSGGGRVIDTSAFQIVMSDSSLNGALIFSAARSLLSSQARKNRGRNSKFLLKKKVLICEAQREKQNHLSGSKLSSSFLTILPPPLPYLDLSLQQLLVLGIYLPSALNKILSPKMFRDLWPTLPGWLWRPTGLFEMTACLCAILGDSRDTPIPGPIVRVGFAMLYSYMGGVLSSLVYIRDTANNTHISGKGKLGRIGQIGPLVATIVSTIMIYVLDPYHHRRGTTHIPVLQLVLRFLPATIWISLGVGIGVYIYESFRRDSPA